VVQDEDVAGSKLKTPGSGGARTLSKAAAAAGGAHVTGPSVLTRAEYMSRMSGTAGDKGSAGAAAATAGPSQGGAGSTADMVGAGQGREHMTSLRRGQHPCHQAVILIPMSLVTYVNAPRPFICEAHRESDILLLASLEPFATGCWQPGSDGQVGEGHCGGPAGHIHVLSVFCCQPGCTSKLSSLLAVLL
jgi:hypothetical protein